MNTRKTKRQKEAELFVDDYISEHGVVPTYQEVADHFGISKTAVYDRLRWYRDNMRQKEIAV